MRNVALGLCLIIIAAMGAPTSSGAVALNIAGTYSGTINGEALSATSSGTLETSGLGNNDDTITFTSIPTGYNPLCLGTSNFTWKCTLPGKDSLGAQNLWDLSQGNYTMTRRFTWETLPKDTILATATVSTTGSNVTGTIVFSGDYNGPTDITGVSDYEITWRYESPTSITEVGRAVVHRSGGESFFVRLESVYSGLSTGLAVPTQVGRMKINTLTYSAGVMNLNWNITLWPRADVPGVSAWGGGVLVIALGALGAVATTRRRRAGLSGNV